ncbi:MAG: hypothetical protein P4L69_18715 [Desulfosporosinus sp.]|nr:hypothetical protein [Desulfosporosinus sp.]
MTTQEKCIIETILVGVGLEPLHVGTDEREPKVKPVRIVLASR